MNHKRKKIQGPCLSPGLAAPRLRPVALVSGAGPSLCRHRRHPEGWTWRQDLSLVLGVRPVLEHCDMRDPAQQLATARAPGRLLER